MIVTIIYSIYFVLNLLAFSIFLIAVYPFFMIFRAKDGWEKLLTKTASLWARLVVYGTGSSVEVVGLEKIPERNVLFVSNHQSYFDIPVVLGFLRRLIGFMAKIELKKIPVLSFWIKKIHCVFIDRKKLREAGRFIDEGVKNLQSGFNMLIFPEGTRSKSSKMKNFKPGSFRLAFESGVPIVPLTINHSYKIFEEKGRISRAKVKIIVHDPVYPESFSSDEKVKIAREIEARIKNCIEE
ncbi:MAG: lysophospholipid acyltransferase family protein [Brevinematia bacterium]